MSVVFFFRKPTPGVYSIEEIFKNLHNYLAAADCPIEPEVKFAPAYSNTIRKILKNIAFARKHQQEVNHITGDIHYIILGLSKKNRNILTIHDCALLHLFPKHSIRYWLYKWLWLDLPVRRADVVTAISQKTKDDIVHFTRCDPSKIVLIPNFVNPVFQYTPYQFNQQQPRILHLGTAWNKNLERVAQALAGIPCILDIIGRLSAEQKKILKKKGIQYENSQNLDNEQVALKYRQCDFVMFASIFEGFGMPIIEAHSSGRPVITSDLSPMREVAGEAAHFVDPHSTEDIRNAVLKIISDAQYRAALISKGRDNVKRFNLETVAGQYVELYFKPLPKTVCAVSPE